MSSCQLMFLGVRSSLESGLDLSLLVPVISLIFTVVSKLLLLYSTIDKTSTLKMKSLEFQKCDVNEKKKEKKERKNEQRKTNKVMKIIKKLQVQN